MSSSSYSSGVKRRNGQEWSRQIVDNKRCAREGLQDSRWIDNPAMNCPSTSTPSPPVSEKHHLAAYPDSPRDVWGSSSGNSSHCDRVICNTRYAPSVDEVEEETVQPGSGRLARYSSRFEHHQREQPEVGDMWRGGQDYGSHPGSSHRAPSNRFNLSRYQLSEEELSHTREKEMPSGEHHGDGDGDVEVERDTLPESPAAYDADWTSLLSPSGNVVDPRKKLLDFREHVAGHGVIPNTWAGEQRLHEWSGFGNIEDALRPLGLVMARASLVSNSTF